MSVQRFGGGGKEIWICLDSTGEPDVRGVLIHADCLTTGEAVFGIVE